MLMNIISEIFSFRQNIKNKSLYSNAIDDEKFILEELSYLILY